MVSRILQKTIEQEEPRLLSYLTLICEKVTPIINYFTIISLSSRCRYAISIF